MVAESKSDFRKSSIRAMKDVWSVLSIDYNISMNNIIVL